MSEEGVIAVIVTTIVVLLALVLITPLFTQTNSGADDSAASQYHDLIRICGQPFILGDADDELWSWCGPAHELKLTYDFYIGRYEVTFAQFDAFCDDTGHSKPPDGPSWSDERWGRGDRPVVNVTWWDAIAFCNWLSEIEGLPVAYRLLGEQDEGQMLDAHGQITVDITEVVGYRLPTEAEWEYAARGGRHHSAFTYSGSDNADEVAWHSGNSRGMPQVVGQKLPNALGVFDMSGNVSEWCTDYYESFSSESRVDPYVSSGTNRVIRGGRWSVPVQFHHVAFRSDSSPNYSMYDLGFRVARTVH